MFAIILNGFDPPLLFPAVDIKSAGFSRHVGAKSDVTAPETWAPPHVSL